MSNLIKTIRIGTRTSRLAMAQTELVANALRKTHRSVRVELVPFVTQGDRVKGSLADAGGKGLFTQRLEAALLAGDIELAVHSAKDLPSEMDDRLAILAVPTREDPRDVLFSRDGLSLPALPQGAVVGTSSVRRAVQLRSSRPDVAVVPLRGNVDTRIAKVLGEKISPEGDCDAAVLALAGLRRLGISEQHHSHYVPLDLNLCIPAPGQGALAIQGRVEEPEWTELLDCIHDEPSAQALLAERDVIRAMSADCHSCIAVHIFRKADSAWQGMAMAARPDGSDGVRAGYLGDSAGQVADELCQEFLRMKVPELLTS